MKFSCTKENLTAALSLASGLASKNVNLPILNNILIRVDEQKTEISSTNLELAVVVNVRAKIEKTGSFTVPARTLTDFINLLSDEKIDFELQGSEIKISCGRSSTKIKGVSAEEYPIIPAAENGKGFLLSAAELQKGLAQTAVAAAKNDIRPELSGVLFSFRDKELTLAATDSYRLAEKKIKVIQGADSFKAIIPGRTAQEIIHMLSNVIGLEAEQNIRLLMSDNQIVANYGNVQLISRLIEGQYPDYVQIIPKDFKTTAEINLDKLIKEVKAASLFTTTGVNGVNFEIEPSGEVKITSASSQTGEYSSEIEAEVSGDKNSILLNFRYVLDGLANLNGDPAALKVINAASPCLLSTKNDPSYIYIVMPIRQ